MNVHLLLIDAQQDFCDGPCCGALAVPGAHEDMLRLADFVGDNLSKIDGIHASMDCHRLHDIAHPAWWQDKDGLHPAPFTIISGKDIEDKIWRPAKPETMARSLSYVKALETAGNYPLCIWPPHCLLGTQGQSLHPAIAVCLMNWEMHTGKAVNYITKGENPWTEHYSALKAEVPDPADQGTQLNNQLLEKLLKADEILIAGEALSHCVQATVSDLADALGVETVRKFVFLSDASSSVAGFEALGQEFLDKYTSLGMRVETTRSYIFKG